MNEESRQERSEKIVQLFEAVMPQIFVRRVAYLNEKLKTEGKICGEEFLEKLRKLHQCWQEDNRDKTEELSYIIISCLSSGIITETYQYQIAFYGKNVYAELNPWCFYWSPSFIYENISEDMVEFKKETAKDILKMSEFEEEELRRKYALMHSSLVMYFLYDLLGEAAKMPEWHHYEKNSIHVLFGSHMEQMSQLCLLGEKV